MGTSLNITSGETIVSMLGMIMCGLKNGHIIKHYKWRNDSFDA